MDISPQTEAGPIRSDSNLRQFGALAGIAGPILLTLYFAIPAFVGWPSAGASPAHLIRYANGHQVLFYAGAWLQATGAVLSVLFFLTLLSLSGARSSFAGLVTPVAAALLLSTVLIEAAFLIAVPMAASNGDAPTVATTFALSNGVFARVFPLAPAPLLFGAIALVLRQSDILPPAFAVAAFVVAALFVVAGIAAIFTTAGLIPAIVMSILQEVWIVAAAIALWTQREAKVRASREEHATTVALGRQ